MLRDFLPSWRPNSNRASSTIHKSRRRSLTLERLDERVLLSSLLGEEFSEPLVAGQLPSVQRAMLNADLSSLTGGVSHGSTILAANGTLPVGSGYTPQQIRNAYGFNQVLSLDGTGTTIAILDPGHDPTIASDLSRFDQSFGLPNPPGFLQVNEYGQSSNYPTLQSAGMSVETSLDVEWAHAIAPGADILLVEFNATPAGTAANGNPLFNVQLGDILQAVNTARTFTINTAGSPASVVAVSMSFFGPGTAADDPYFTTPGNHGGVTFVAASGDTGGQSAWPATSPNVLSVGGTDLPLNSFGTYPGTGTVGEIGWSGSSGGITSEPMPGYQGGVVPYSMSAVNGVLYRTSPDVAYNAGYGVAVYDSFANGAQPWVFAGQGGVGGTSAGAPQWAGLVALADEGRAHLGLGSLDGARQTLPLLYDMPTSAFNDVTSGRNAQYSAGPGYDLVTGLGTPVAPQVVAGLEQLNWTNLEGGVSSVTAVALPGGGQEVFAIATNGDPANGASPGAVWTRTQTVPGGPWSNWSCLYGSVSAIAVARESNGDLELFAIATTAGDGIWSKTLDAATGTWSTAWFSLGSGNDHAIAVANDAHGNVVLFAIASDNAVWTRTQAGPGGPWSGWLSLGGAVSAITAGTDSGGDIEVFAIATSAGDGIWSKTLNAATGSWSPSWFSLGSGNDSAITVGKDYYGDLVLFAIASDQAVWTRTQIGPNGPWSGWMSLGGAVYRIAVGTDSRGQLELFGTTVGDDAVWTRTLNPATGTWSGWLGSVFTAYAISADTNLDGSLELFATSSVDLSLWATRVP
jgi:hypothetical protein